MGAQHTYGTAGATGGGWSSQPGTLQPAFEESTAEPRWFWQARSPKTRKDRNNWYSLWSYGCRTGGGTINGDESPTGGSLSSRDLFEPYSCDGEGTVNSRFILGTALASDGTTPVANATIQAFRTTDELFVGESVSRLDGTYTCPVATIEGVAHYLVAYKAGSPDIAGTTVNTLTSTLVDGS